MQVNAFSLFSKVMHLENSLQSCTLNVDMINIDNWRLVTALTAKAIPLYFQHTKGETGLLLELYLIALTVVLAPCAFRDTRLLPSFVGDKSRGVAEGWITLVLVGEGAGARG